MVKLAVHVEGTLNRKKIKFWLASNTTLLISMQETRSWYKEENVTLTKNQSIAIS